MFECVLKLTEVKIAARHSTLAGNAEAELLLQTLRPDTVTFMQLFKDQIVKYKVIPSLISEKKV